MADNLLIVISGGTAAVRTVDRSGTHSGVSIVDIAQSGEAELLGLGDGRTKKVTSAGLTTASTAYTAGDQMGTEITISNAVRTGKSCTIIDAVLIDKAKVCSSIDLLITDASVTLASDNAAHSLSDADALKVLSAPAIHFTDRIVSANNYILGAVNLPLGPLKPASGTSLFAHYLAAASTTSFFGAVGDLEAYLEIQQD